MGSRGCLQGCSCGSRNVLGKFHIRLSMKWWDLFCSSGEWVVLVEPDGGRGLPFGDHQYPEHTSHLVSSGSWVVVVVERRTTRRFSAPRNVTWWWWKGEDLRLVSFFFASAAPTVQRRFLSGCLGGGTVQEACASIVAAFSVVQHEADPPAEERNEPRWQKVPTETYGAAPCPQWRHRTLTFILRLMTDKLEKHLFLKNGWGDALKSAAPICSLFRLKCFSFFKPEGQRAKVSLLTEVSPLCPLSCLWRGFI